MKIKAKWVTWDYNWTHEPKLYAAFESLRGGFIAFVPPADRVGRVH